MLCSLLIYASRYNFVQDLFSTSYIHLTIDMDLLLVQPRGALDVSSAWGETQNVRFHRSVFNKMVTGSEDATTLLKLPVVISNPRCRIFQNHANRM